MSTEAETGPSTEHKFAVPLAPPLTPCKGSSKGPLPATAPEEDNGRYNHIPGCSYYMLDVVHRKSLLTDDVVEDYLVEWSPRFRRQKKSTNWNQKVEEAKAREKAKKVLSSGIIRDYLNDGKKLFDSFKETFSKKFCECGNYPADAGGEKKNN